MLVVVGIMAVATGPTHAQWTGARDTEPPAVTITGVPEDATKKPFAANFVFSEDVTGFNLDSISVTNATLSDFRGNRKNYQVKVKPNGKGNVTITVKAHVATDAARITGPIAEVSAVARFLPQTKKQDPSAKKDDEDDAFEKSLKAIKEIQNLNPPASEARKKAEEGAEVGSAQLLQPIQPINRDDEEFLPLHLNQK